MRQTSKLLPIAMLAVGLAFAAPATGYDGDAGAIRHLMMTTFNTPEAPLIVEPTRWRELSVSPVRAALTALKAWS